MQLAMWPLLDPGLPAAPLSAGPSTGVALASVGADGSGAHVSLDRRARADLRYRARAATSTAARMASTTSSCWPVVIVANIGSVTVRAA
jgi:hypothetical protein